MGCYPIYSNTTTVIVTIYISFMFQSETFWGKFFESFYPQPHGDGIKKAVFGSIVTSLKK